MGSLCTQHVINKQCKFCFLFPFILISFNLLLLLLHLDWFGHRHCTVEEKESVCYWKVGTGCSQFKSQQTGWIGGKESVSHSVMSNSLHLMDCSPPGPSVHRILQARILEWVAISFSRRDSWPRDQTWVSCIARKFFTIWATKQAQWKGKLALFQMLETVQKPTPLIDNQWARAFISCGRGLREETAQSALIILKLVICGLTSVFFTFSFFFHLFLLVEG